MPRNLEIKARLSSIEFGVSKALAAGARYEGVLHQIDTYFNVSHDRLKLREEDSGKGELIYYKRGEESNQRVSQFEIYQCDDVATLKSILKKAYGVRSTVDKKRLLYMLDEARIHLDTVKELGLFLEFETFIQSDVEKARVSLEMLIRHFGIREEDFVRQSYVDSMEEKQQESVKPAC